MRTLKRNKRPLYLCTKYEEDGLTKFKEPILLYEDYLPTNSDGDLITIGLDFPKYLRIKTDISEKDLFHAKDRLYVYKNKPNKHDVLCRDADYEVFKNPSIYINNVEIMLYRLSGDTDE